MAENTENEKRYPKRIPYGMMNFVAVRRDDCYYVDKTRYIEKIERANKFFFFIRPRRFGKSLTMSMLQHYYDVNDADKFDMLYKGLYIGDHPTPERNKYLVIILNFSIVDASLDSYQQGLDDHCNIRFCSFCDRYSRLLPPETKDEMNKRTGAIKQLDYLCDVCSELGLKIYLFIDEYDHFTNKILAEPGCLDAYRQETHGTGYLRLFFDSVKTGTYSSIERVFVTGVSPVTMDDLTSGFNIGTNYTLNYEFNEMVGFTENEVRAMLTYYTDFCNLHKYTVDELIEIMKPWYDNYCFAEDAYGETTMYNSNMVLYFIDNYVSSKGRLPRNMVEENIRVDYNKLRMLIRRDKEFAHDASVIQNLVNNGYITGTLKTGFSAENIGDPDNFISLLYYFGMVTIAGTHEGDTKFVIPNEVVREQIFRYLLDTYKENDLTFENYEMSPLCSRLAYRGQWKEYFQYIADAIHRYSSQRDKQKGEYFVHGFPLAMTCQNRFYRPISESDTQEGYADIFMMPLLDIYSDMLHSYIIELKYAKSKDPETRVEELRKQATEQVKRYSDTEMVKSAVKTTTLHRIVVVFHGTEMVVCEEV